MSKREFPTSLKNMFFLKAERRTSLLLEILLACTLLSLAAAPLVQKPIELYRQQMQTLKSVEKERLADLSFAEVKLQLLKQQIPWKKLPTKELKETILDLPAALLQIPHYEPSPLERRAVLRYQKEKLSTAGELVRLLEIEIQFAPFEKPSSPRYLYKITVKKAAIPQ